MRRPSQWGMVVRGISAILSLFPAPLLLEVWQCQRKRLGQEVQSWDRLTETMSRVLSAEPQEG